MYQLLNFILKEIVEWYIAGIFLHSVPFSTIINILNEGICDIILLTYFQISQKYNSRFKKTLANWNNGGKLAE